MFSPLVCYPTLATNRTPALLCIAEMCTILVSYACIVGYVPCCYEIYVFTTSVCATLLDFVDRNIVLLLERYFRQYMSIYIHGKSEREEYDTRSMSPARNGQLVRFYARRLDWLERIRVAGYQCHNGGDATYLNVVPIPSALRLELYPKHSGCVLRSFS